MGVKELWSVVSPTGQVLPLTALTGQVIAVDLSCWVMDTKSLNLVQVTQPHLRNLLFRTLALISAGVKPVFVLEGEAPDLKWTTIKSRNKKTYNSSRSTANIEVSKKTTTRSHFKSVLKECQELMELLGVPCVQAEGEAEATCAALSYHQVVEGVISQDSDVFLYGGKTVFRNFTANRSKGTLEKFSMDVVEARLGLTREDMILLALLLGCDYRPQGVPGIGKDTALRFIQVLHSQGETNPISRLRLWADQPRTALQKIKLTSTKWKNGSDDELEHGVRVRLEAAPDYPFNDVVHEFERQLSLPIKKVMWHKPSLEGLVKWCITKLGWEASYAVEKICPAVTHWVVSREAPLTTLQPLSVVKQCVKHGVPSCSVEWQLSCPNLNLDLTSHITTVEPLHLIQSSFPLLIQQFEENVSAKKKGKTRKKNNVKNCTKNSSRQINQNTIKEYMKKPETSPQIATVTDQQCDNDTNTYTESLTNVTSYTSNLEENSVIVMNQMDMTSTYESASGEVYYENDKQGETGEQEKENGKRGEEDEDDADLSLIINRIMNIKLLSQSSCSKVGS